MAAYDFELPFQRKLVAAGWKDGKLLRDREIFNPEFLSDELLAGVLRALQDLQSTTGNVPDLPAVVEALRHQVAPGRKWGEYAEEAKRVWAKTSQDLAYYGGQAVEFARRAAVAKAVDEAHALVQDGNLDEIESMFRRALRIGGSNDAVTDLFGSSAERFQSYVEANERGSRGRVATGIGPLDRETRGGLGPGEIGLILGLLGTGKSHTVHEIGTHAALCGHTVLHVSLENSLDVVNSRYDTRLVGFPLDVLVKKPKGFAWKFDKLREKLKSKLLTSFFPSKSLSLGKLEAHIESVDPRPSLVLVDYAALLQPPPRVDERRLQLVQLFEGLRGVSARTGAPIWTPHQANRPGMESGHLDARHIAECFEIGGIVDVGFSLNVKADRPALADLYVFKNRLGKSEFSIPVEIDWGISKMTALSEG